MIRWRTIAALFKRCDHEYTEVARAEPRFDVLFARYTVRVLLECRHCRASAVEFECQCGPCTEARNAREGIGCPRSWPRPGI